MAHGMWVRVLTLEVALVGLGIAGKRSLGLLVLQRVENLPVGDVAHLEVLLDKLAILVADAALAIRHHGATSVVCFANIAIDS